MKKIILFIALLLSGTSVFANIFNWEFMPENARSDEIISALEDEFGEGDLSLPDGIWRAEGDFLGMRNVFIEVTVVDNLWVSSMKFSWIEREISSDQIRLYWLNFFNAILNAQPRLSIFTGNMVWSLPNGFLVFGYDIETSISNLEPKRVEGSFSSIGSSRRLYSIDGEVYENQTIYSFDNVTIGQESEVEQESVDISLEFRWNKPSWVNEMQELAHDDHVDDDYAVVPDMG